MKTMKRIASLLLALCVMFAMSATAFAANTDANTITITGAKTGHVYEAYQVFSGDLATDGKNFQVSNGAMA